MKSRRKREKGEQRGRYSRILETREKKDREREKERRGMDEGAAELGVGDERNATGHKRIREKKKKREEKIGYKKKKKR